MAMGRRLHARLTRLEAGAAAARGAAFRAWVATLTDEELDAVLAATILACDEPSHPAGARAPAPPSRAQLDARREECVAWWKALSEEDRAELDRRGRAGAPLP
jgi:hypothetical protein